MLTGNRCKFCKKRLGEKFYVKGAGACCAECYNTTRCGIFNIPDHRLHISIFYYQITDLNILLPDYTSQYSITRLQYSFTGLHDFRCAVCCQVITEGHVTFGDKSIHTKCMKVP